MNDLLQYALRFRRLYQKWFQDLGEELELSPLEMDLLLFLHNNPDRNTARDAVAVRGLAQSNVSTAVERLSREHWLRVEPDPVSRRVKRLVLLPWRQEGLEALCARQAAFFEAILAGFSPQDRQALSALMDRLNGNVQAALDRME